MKTKYKCGCKVNLGAWSLCKKHQNKLMDFLHTETNTISDIVQDKKGRTIKYINERPM